jgi:hypothetical protein
MEQVKNYAEYVHKSLLASTNERGINFTPQEVEEKYNAHVNSEISSLEKRKENGKDKVASMITGESVDIDTEISYLNAVLKAYPGVKSKDKPKVEQQSDVEGKDIEQKVINPSKKQK